VLGLYEVVGIENISFNSAQLRSKVNIIDFCEIQNNATFLSSY